MTEVIKERVKEGDAVVHYETDTEVVLHDNKALSEKLASTDNQIVSMKAALSTLGQQLSNMGSGSVSAVAVASTWSEACSKRLATMCQSWTPVVCDTQRFIPKANSKTTIEKYNANARVMGMPYSSTKEVDKYVGFNVLMHTFMSCVGNIFSKLYTETLDARFSRSAHGITYHGYECGPYMGVQCTSFVSYVLGLPTYILSHQFDWAEKCGFYISKGAVSAEKVQLWDVVYISGHDMLVSRVDRDKNGAVTAIDVVESIGSSIHRNGQNIIYNPAPYSAAEFNARFCGNDYTLYRVSQRADLSLEYEQVNDTFYKDIIPIEGDRSMMRKGDDVKMAVQSTDGYTNVIVERNESKYVWVDGPGYSSEERWVQVANKPLDGTHYCDIGTSLAAGLYRASMVGGSKQSRYTYFEIVDTSVTCSVSGNIARITFKSEKTSNGKTYKQGRPIYIDFCTTEGNSVARYLIKAEDLLNGYADVDARQLMKWQDRSKVSDDATGYKLENGYVKVLFKSEYGMLASNMVKSGY